MVDRISAAEAKRRMDEEGYSFVDVRSVPEFEQGHPEGAYNIPIMTMGAGGMRPNAAFMAVIEKTFAKDAKLVLGCRSGGRSLRAAEILAGAGWTHVVDQRGGWAGQRSPFGQVTEQGWETAGLPAATEAAEGRSYAELE